MTKLQCDCGKFKAELNHFPQNSPGRCVCYCDDCQTYMHWLGRSDLLDAHGGSEIIPVYPADLKLIEGQNLLSCVRLSPTGMFRWQTSCCHTPLGNCRPNFPWLGTSKRMYQVGGADYLEKTAGPIRSGIHARDAKGPPPNGASQKIAFKDFKVIFPFLLKGFLKSSRKKSPLFEADGITPIVTPRVLSLQERNEIRERLGFRRI